MLLFSAFSSVSSVTANSPYEDSIISPSSSSMPTFLPRETIFPLRSESIRTTLWPTFRWFSLAFWSFGSAGKAFFFAHASMSEAFAKVTFPFRALKSDMMVFLDIFYKDNGESLNFINFDV